MTREEALKKLDEAIADKTFHHSARDYYASLCDTPKDRESFERILNVTRQHDREWKEKKALKAAKKAARDKGVRHDS
jgi:lipopolysaccharide biosynthesis regulator YciM